MRHSWAHVCSIKVFQLDAYRLQVKMLPRRTIDYGQLKWPHWPWRQIFLNIQIFGFSPPAMSHRLFFHPFCFIFGGCGSFWGQTKTKPMAPLFKNLPFCGEMDSLTFFHHFPPTGKRPIHPTRTSPHCLVTQTTPKIPFWICHDQMFSLSPNSPWLSPDKKTPIFWESVDSNAQVLPSWYLIFSPSFDNPAVFLSQRKNLSS